MLRNSTLSCFVRTGCIEHGDFLEAALPEERKNIVLIGDSLGDVRMADGIEDINVVLSIGFLNKNVEANLSEYKRCFDIVLVDDQTMDFPLALLEDILDANDQKQC